MTASGIVLHTAADPSQAFEPRGIDEAMNLASLLVASRLLPKSVQTPEAAFAIIATGRELGLTAMQSLRTIHVIEGKPTLSADLMAALVKSRRDVCAYFMLVESSERAAVYRTQRVGEPEATTMSFTIEDAQRAGVTGKDNWRKYPSAMLRARCIAALARAVYPDLAMGIYDEDELSPVPVEEAAKWVPEPAAKPAVDAGPLLASYFARIDAAESGGALNSVAAGSSKARRDGVISESQFADVKSAVSRKRRLIADSQELSPEQLDGQRAADAGVSSTERQPGED